MTPHEVASQLLQGFVLSSGALLLGLLAGIGAATAGRWRLAFAVLAAPAAVMFTLSLPWIADRLSLPLELRALALSRSGLASGPLPRTAVVLGGAVHAAGPDEKAAATGYDLAAEADRVVAAARLWRTGQVDRLVLSGGSPRKPSEAELMARFAVDLGVPRSAMLLEGESRTTHENATRVAEVLRRYGLSREVALVSSALHLPRAMEEFRCAGLVPVVVPAEYDVLGADRELPAAWIPSSEAADRSRRALKEWVGLLLSARCP